MQKRSIIAVCLVLAVIIVAVAFTVWRSGDMPFGDVDPVAERRSEYTTSVGCRECHAEEYNSWHDSFHRTMTQEASADSVVAPFDDVTVSSRGRSFRFYKRGDEFRVQMMDITSEAKRKLRGHPTEGVRNLPENDRQIVMTTGSHHHQVYWVKGAGNEFKQVPFVYHIATKQWIPNEDSFLQPDSDEHQSQRWNDNCIVCHTVAGRPGFEVIANANNPKVGRFNSSFVELGIACEACHGPGDRHAEAHRRSGTKSPGIESTDHNPSIINPARLDSHRSAAICGQCHAHFVPRDSIPWNEYGFTTSFRPGELLDESRVIVRYNSALKHSADMKTDQEFDSAVSAFWKDGTHRVGGREYNGLIESGCYQRGKMSCLSCHSMHDYSEPNDQLSKILNENETCLQCHNDFADRIS